ncbi:Alpha/Beta hydrolase protein [Aspergillus heterothallicus]
MAAQSRPLFTRHPFKFLYTACFLAALPFRLLALALYYSPPLTRPNRTFRQAITTKIIFLLFRYWTTVEAQPTRSLTPGKDKDRFVLLDPAQITHPHSASAYTGPLSINPAIRPAPIAGFWYEAPPQPDPTTPPELLAIAFHGGAYVSGFARPGESGWGATALSKRLGCPVLMPQYRLSDTRDRSTTFPAALQDAVTAYLYVLYTLKVKPENIVLSGDSAGANLVLALLRYIKAQQNANSNTDGGVALPSPRAALLWGPWVDLDAPAMEIDHNRNAGTDYLFGDLGKWGVGAYVPDGMDSAHELYPYISPLGREFYTEVPMFMHTSTAEILHDSHCAFAKNLKEVGCRVEVVEMDYAAHNTFTTADFTGYEEEMAAVMDRVAEFVNVEVGKKP